MWYRLPPLLVLLMLSALLPSAGADTVSEFDRCVLGDCEPLAVAGGATVAAADGAGGRTRDGASVAALKRSAEDSPVDAAEQDEGSGEGEPTVDGKGGSFNAALIEESQPAAGAEEVTPAPGESDPAAAGAGGVATSPPPAAPTAADEEAQDGGGGPTETPGDGGTANSGGDTDSGSGDDGPARGGARSAEDELDRRTDHCTCDLTVSARQYICTRYLQ